MPSVELQRFLLVDEVASQLRISRSEVYALVREGLLPALRVGRSIRLDERALRDFIASGGRGWPGGWRKRTGGGEAACRARTQA